MPAGGVNLRGVFGHSRKSPDCCSCQEGQPGRVVPGPGSRISLISRYAWGSVHSLIAISSIVRRAASWAS